MNRASVHHITRILTSDAIERAIGVSAHAVRYAKTTGCFPASWYAQVKAMCDEVGIPCPLTAFNWKPHAHDAADQSAEDQVTQKANARGAA